MTANKNGIAAREVQRKYGLTPKSAWFLTQRIREAIVETLGVDLAGLATPRKGRRLRRPPFGVSPSMQPCWQYRIERRERVEADFLNDLGDEGWELVSVHPHADWLELIFKRRRFPGALRAAG